MARGDARYKRKVAEWTQMAHELDRLANRVDPDRARGVAAALGIEDRDEVICGIEVGKSFLRGNGVRRVDGLLHRANGYSVA
jgi:hypothetical protein